MRTAAGPLTASLMLAVATFFAAPARGGDCPECMSAQDCASRGGFCVRHRRPVGCGTRVQLCCPGQACAIGPNGRPSCESAGSCEVISGPGDAGAQDVPVAPSDSGVAPDGAAPGSSDAGGEAGTGSGSLGATSGCACRTAARVSPHGGCLAVLAAAGLGLRRVRRRRAAPR